MQDVSIYQRIESAVLAVVEREPGRTEQEIINVVRWHTGIYAVSLRQSLAAAVASKKLLQKDDLYFLPGQLQIRGVLVSKLRSDIYVQQEDFQPIWDGEKTQLTCKLEGARVDQQVTLWERCGEDFTGRSILATVGAVYVVHSGQLVMCLWLKDIQKVDDESVAAQKNFEVARQ